MQTLSEQTLVTDVLYQDFNFVIQNTDNTYCRFDKNTGVKYVTSDRRAYGLHFNVNRFETGETVINILSNGDYLDQNNIYPIKIGTHTVEFIRANTLKSTLVDSVTASNGITYRKSNLQVHAAELFVSIDGNRWTKATQLTVEPGNLLHVTGTKPIKISVPDSPMRKENKKALLAWGNELMLQLSINPEILKGELASSYSNEYRNYLYKCENNTKLADLKLASTTWKPEQQKLMLYIIGKINKLNLENYLTYKRPFGVNDLIKLFNDKFIKATVDKDFDYITFEEITK